MSLSATLFGTDSLIFKATNILGLGIPGLLHKEFGPGEPEAQRLGEISRQTAKEAEPRVIVWGRVRPIGGNLIHCQEPIKRMIKQSSSGGGKGGGSKKQEQKVEHVFRSYAIGVCEGPITGFSRIWRNNKLVYDARGNEWGQKNNPVFLKTFRLYLGGWNQMPDPTLESIWGAGQVPAYRGTAYMVSIDEDLTDMGGAVPQWQFEVERAEGIVVTSRPYSLDVDESSAAKGVGIREEPNYFRIESTSARNVMIAGGTFNKEFSFHDYDYGIENSTVLSVAIAGGTFSTVFALNIYDRWPPESSTALSASITGGDFNTEFSVITYSNWPPESSGVTAVSIVGGTHESDS